MQLEALSLRGFGLGGMQGLIALQVYAAFCVPTEPRQSALFLLFEVGSQYLEMTPK